MSNINQANLETLSALLVALRQPEDFSGAMQREEWATALGGLLTQLQDAHAKTEKKEGWTEERQAVHDKNVAYRHIKNYLVNDLKLNVTHVTSIVEAHAAASIAGMLQEDRWKYIFTQTMKAAVDRVIHEHLRAVVSLAIEKRMTISMAPSVPVPVPGDGADKVRCVPCDGTGKVRCDHVWAVVPRGARCTRCGTEMTHQP